MEWDLNYFLRNQKLVYFEKVRRVKLRDSNSCICTALAEERICLLFSVTLMLYSACFRE